MALGNKTLDDLLGPISKQLEHDRVAARVDMPAWEFKASRLTDGLAHDALVDLFESEAGKIRVKVERCSADELAKCLAGIVGKGVPESGDACTVVCASDERFEKAGLVDALKVESKVAGVTAWDEKHAQESIDAAYSATFGITYASAGIAETGTVVQPTNAKCGRAVSLLPLAHIAVVDAATIEPTMLEVMQAYGDGKTLPSQVCFISGPSATADIELVRVEGVHGPMYVYYVIVE